MPFLYLNYRLVLSILTNKMDIPLKIRPMSKERLFKPLRKPGELLLKTTLKESRTPWKLNVKKWGLAFLLNVSEVSDVSELTALSFLFISSICFSKRMYCFCLTSAPALRCHYQRAVFWMKTPRQYFGEHEL